MITLDYEYQCDACGRTTQASGPEDQPRKRYEVFLDYGEPLPRPSLPWSWFRVGRLIFCDKHNLTLILRDKETGAVSSLLLEK